MNLQQRLINLHAAIEMNRSLGYDSDGLLDAVLIGLERLTEDAAWGTSPATEKETIISVEEHEFDQQAVELLRSLVNVAKPIMYKLRYSGLPSVEEFITFTREWGRSRKHLNSLTTEPDKEEEDD